MSGTLELVLTEDSHFAWLLGEAAAPEGLRAPASGVEEPDVLRHLRRMTADLHAAGCKASWLVVDAGEVVGLCNFKAPPDGTRTAEIGYGVAPARRRRGYAAEAVRLLMGEVVRAGLASHLTARTDGANIASQKVLQKNGFSQGDTITIPKKGVLISWSRSCS